jgi:hypothetical protein
MGEWQARNVCGSVLDLVGNYRDHLAKMGRENSSRCGAPEPP